VVHFAYIPWRGLFLRDARARRILPGRWPAPHAPLPQADTPAAAHRTAGKRDRGFLVHWDFRLLLAIGTVSAFAGFFRIGLIRKFAKEGYDQIGYPEQGAPPATVMFSLAPRQLKEYRVAWFEWLVRGALVLGLGMLAYAGARDGADADWPHLLGIPLGFLYLLLGLHLVQKHLVTARLLRLPGGAPEKYLAYREDFRRHWLRMTDLVRMLLAAIILVLGIQNALPDDWLTVSFRIYASQGIVWASIAICLIGVLRLTRRFLARARQVGPYMHCTKPVPEPTQARGFAGYFCWESELPGMIVRGETHNLFNLGSPQMRTYGLYLAGWALFAGIAFL